MQTTIESLSHDLLEAYEVFNQKATRMNGVQRWGSMIDLHLPSSPDGPSWHEALRKECADWRDKLNACASAWLAHIGKGAGA